MSFERKNVSLTMETIAMGEYLVKELHLDDFSNMVRYLITDAYTSAKDHNKSHKISTEASIARLELEMANLKQAQARLEKERADSKHAYTSKVCELESQNPHFVPQNER